ncbi:hypothetical protein SynA1528_00448 [Synechococcus sp. A15-28]|nr:hypothetical protein SynA1528_00448 [Synechococcus sp. A15-28]
MTLRHLWLGYPVDFIRLANDIFQNISSIFFTPFFHKV